MKKAQRILSVALALLFVFVGLNLNAFAAAKVVKPKVIISVQPKTQYFVGDRISLSVKAPNYKGKVQYRIHVRNSKGQIVNELFAKYSGKYYNKQISAQGNFNVGFSVKTPGTYYVVVYVKRPGAKVNYDSYVVSRRFVVREKVAVEEPKEEEPTEEPKDVVLDKEGQEFTKETIEKDVYLKANNTRLYNAKVKGTVYVNPGENGNATLENVEAEKIVVLSGAKNSIHFKSVKAKNLEVKAEKGVRVVAEGATAIEQTNVLSEAIVEVKAGSVGKVVVEKEAAGKTIELKGNFATVEVLAEVKVVVTEGKIEKIDVKAKAEVVVNKDAVVVDVVKNNNEVKISGEGKVEKVDGKEQTASTGGTSGGYVSPEYQAFESYISKLMTDAIAVKNEHQQIYSNYVNSIDYSNRTLTVNLKSTAANETLSSLYAKAIFKLDQGKHADLTAADKALIDDFLGLNGLLNNTRITAPGLNNVTLKTYAEIKLSGHQALVNFINDPSEANYDALRERLLDSYDSYAEAALFLHSLVPQDDVTLDNILVHGLSLYELSIDSTKVYGGSDKTLTLNEIKTALGVNGAAGDVNIATVLGQDKTMTVTMKLQGSTGTIYTYKLVINLE